MQKTINIMTKTALAIIAAVLATGCFFEKMEMPKDLQNVLIQINVSADDMLTKAAPTESESAINTLHVYAFQGDALVGYYHREATAADEHFYMDLTLPETGTHSVDFYLVANAASMMLHNDPVSLGSEMTRAGLEALKYSRIAAGSPLPMYCKQTETINVDDISRTANTEEGHENHLLLVQQVDFSLSRSLAKLSVYGAKPAGATTSPEIIFVTMLSAGTREYSYLFPQTDDVLNTVPSLANDRILLAEGSSVALEELTGDGSAADHYTPVAVVPTYISEVAVGGNLSEWMTLVNDRQLALKLEYVLNPSGAVKTGFVYMPRIERNTHYKVCILVSEEDEGRIHITYEVADWEEHAMPGYTFTYPSHSYLRDHVPTSSDDTADPSYAAEMSLTSPFVGYFQMTAPANDEWQPTLIGDHASDADIKIYDYDTDDEILQSTWPIEASSKWYKVVVIPHNDMAVGNTVDLAITYQPDLITSSEYLLINGSSGNYYWPGSTDANFVTITMVN